MQWLSAKGEFLAEWALPEQEGPKFQSPTALVRDARGFLYVSDIANNRIYKLEMVSGGTK